MIVATSDFKNACSKILYAMDTSGVESFVGRVELKTANSTLFMNVTNGEYFVEVKLCNCEEDFHATVNADVFLKLSAKLTTEHVEFTVSETSLQIKSDGRYKIPLIYDGSEILELPSITIENQTTNFNIDGNILNSILINNGKELLKINKNSIVNDIQRMYYIDDKGAITFTTGACVNKFSLEKPVKMLVSAKIVKLFSLFKGTIVDFSMGFDNIGGDIFQTKVRFSTDSIRITAILNCDDSMVSKVPAPVIREKAYYVHENVATIERFMLLSAVNRLRIFVSDVFSMNNRDIGKFTFKNDRVVITDGTGDNSEEVMYAKPLSYDVLYNTTVDLEDIKLALETNTDQYITIGFSEDNPMVIARDNIYIVIKEM